MTELFVASRVAPRGALDEIYELQLPSHANERSAVMRLIIACVIMCATTAFASSSQSELAPTKMNANADSLSCPGTPPCCEWDSDGSCTVIAFCWGPGW